MAYHTIGQFQKRHYNATNVSSGGTASVAVGNRAKLVDVFQACSVTQTAAAGSWTVSLNGTQITGLSSVAVSSGVAGVQQTNAQPSSPTYLSRGDVLSVAPSSMTVSNWTFVVQEF